MTEMAAYPPEASPLAGIVGTIAQMAKRIVAAHVRWRSRRKTARILSGLSDETLKDLGLTRADHGGKDDIRNWRTINRWR